MVLESPPTHPPHGTIQGLKREERKKKKILLDSALAGMSRDGRFRLGILERERTNDSLPFLTRSNPVSLPHQQPPYLFLFVFKFSFRSVAISVWYLEHINGRTERAFPCLISQIARSRIARASSARTVSEVGEVEKVGKKKIVLKGNRTCN